LRLGNGMGLKKQRSLKRQSGPPKTKITNPTDNPAHVRPAGGFGIVHTPRLSCRTVGTVQIFAPAERVIWRISADTGASAGLPGAEEPPMRETVAPRLPSRPLLIAGAAFMAALAGTTLLWAHYGAAVFFEIIRAGVAACFG
jgi:hypothetical protein